jgi:hypothetical protein
MTVEYILAPVFQLQLLHEYTNSKADTRGAGFFFGGGGNTTVKLFVYEFVTLNFAALFLTVWRQYFHLLCVWLSYPLQVMFEYTHKVPC